MNCRPPTATVSTHTSAFDAVAFQLRPRKSFHRGFNLPFGMQHYYPRLKRRTMDDVDSLRSPDKLTFTGVDSRRDGVLYWTRLMSPAIATFKYCFSYTPLLSKLIFNSKMPKHSAPRTEKPERDDDRRLHQAHQGMLPLDEAPPAITLRGIFCGHVLRLWLFNINCSFKVSTKEATEGKRRR